MERGHGSEGRATEFVVADSQPIYGHGLAALIEREAPDMAVASVSTSVEELDVALRDRPHIALIDLALPRLDVGRVLHRTGAVESPTRVVFLTVTWNVTQLRRLLEMGAVGLFTKDRTASEIVAGLRAVMCSNIVVPATFTASLDSERAVSQLTEGDRRLLQAIALGESNRIIALRFDMSERTVRRHLERIYRRLNLANRHEAMVFAVRHLG
jgi:DNA-binding NarL/FixJ family response regulator